MHELIEHTQGIVGIREMNAKSVVLSVQPVITTKRFDWLILVGKIILTNIYPYNFIHQRVTSWHQSMGGLNNLFVRKLY